MIYLLKKREMAVCLRILIKKYISERVRERDFNSKYILFIIYLYTSNNCVFKSCWLFLSCCIKVEKSY